jgi:hypothetical protein
MQCTLLLLVAGISVLHCCTQPVFHTVMHHAMKTYGDGGITPPFFTSAVQSICYSFCPMLIPYCHIFFFSLSQISLLGTLMSKQFLLNLWWHIQEGNWGGDVLTKHSALCCTSYPQRQPTIKKTRTEFLCDIFMWFTRKAQWPVYYACNTSRPGWQYGLLWGLIASWEGNLCLYTNQAINWTTEELGLHYRQGKMIFLLQRFHTGSGAHQDCCLLGFNGSFLEVEWLRHEDEHLPPSSAKVENAWTYLHL